MAKNFDYPQGGVLRVPENHFEIDRSTHIRTSVMNKEFYNLIVDEKKIFAAKHQLYTFAIMVAVFHEADPDTSTKSEDICLVGNVNSDNLAIAKGIVSQLCPNIKSGSELLKRMTEYADAGINILRVEYENNGTLRLDNYIE